MNSELKPLVKQAGARPQTKDGRTVHSARVGKTEAVMVQIGVGPGAARSTTEWALTSFEVDHVLVSGIAGGVHPDLKVGAVVVPEVILDVDEGGRFDSSPMRGVDRQGIVGTSDRLISDKQQLSQLQEEGVLALEMESAGVAAACEAKGVPWTTFRVISDRPDNHPLDDSMLSLVRPDGSVRIAAALGFMARHPSRIPDMVQMHRDSAMAASKVARVALSALRR